MVLQRLVDVVDDQLVLDGDVGSRALASRDSGSDFEIALGRHLLPHLRIHGRHRRFSHRQVSRPE